MGRPNVLSKGTGQVGRLIVGRQFPILIFTINDAPTESTGANEPGNGKGSMLVNVATGDWYKNTGTGAAPTWTPIGLAAGTVGVAAGYKIARGQHTTVDENDTVVTGLATVVSVVASLDDDPVAGCSKVTASRGNQAGAPAAGSILIKTWEADETVATTFGKKVNWIAVGT